MPLVQWGPWTPDVSDYEGASVHAISNVLPRGDGYGPFASLSPYAQALPAPCRGAFYALKNDGSVVTFAGTSNKLYQLNNTNYGWTDVSLGRRHLQHARVQRQLELRASRQSGVCDAGRRAAAGI